ncbi:MAG: hypothetical protein GEU86_04520 [Actinophytocola sp.]|nr:hypothetical protein [Actinophytocola sp.]
MGRHSKVEPPPVPPRGMEQRPASRRNMAPPPASRRNMAPPPASRRAADPAATSTTLTGTHRAVDGKSRRGIAKWPIAVAAVLALIGTGVTAMIWGINSINSAAEAEAQGCSEGKRMLRVAVAPKLEQPMSAIATRWNSLDRPVHSHCITVEIGASSSEGVLDELSDSDDVQSVPAAWIAESKESSERLSEADPERVATVAEPLSSASGFVYPYIVVGGDGVDEIQQRAAQKFRDFLNESEQIATLRAAGFSG